MLRVISIAALASVVCAQCDGPFVVSAGSGVMLDACGRERRFRGLNSVMKNPPFMYDAFNYRGGGLSLSPADAALWRSLGFNAVRLGAMWSGVSPSRNTVNATYLDGMANLIRALHDGFGIHTLLDGHQDTFSPAFCNDGAPAWAAAVYSAGAPGFPEPLLPAFPLGNATGLPSPGDCARLGWTDYYFTSAVGRAFQVLYTTPAAIADYGAFWAAIVASNRGNSASLIGIEVLNEPWAGDTLADPLLLIPGLADAINLQPFYMNVSLAIRAAEMAAGAAKHILTSHLHRKNFPRRIFCPPRL